MNDHLSHRLIGPEGHFRGLRPTWISPGRVDDPVWSCTGRGLPGRRVTTTPVRSYRTFSPLPDRDSRVVAPSAVYFCGTFPRVSPGGRYPPSLPFGVRTFLEEFSLSPQPSDPQTHCTRHFQETDVHHTNEMHTYRERLLIFPDLLLNLRLKIAENGGPKGLWSRGESLASAR